MDRRLPAILADNGAIFAKLVVLWLFTPEFRLSEILIGYWSVHHRGPL
jgi:hypothetical protein